MAARLRGDGGGIRALVRVDADTDGALDYDLMCRLGIRLADVPMTIGWSGLKVFYRHLDGASATWRAQHPEYAPYSTPFGIAQMLADVIDMEQWVCYGIAAAHHARGKRPPRKPKPYEAPWRKGDHGDRHVGSGAIPRSEFLDWYYGDGDQRKTG